MIQQTFCSQYHRTIVWQSFYPSISKSPCYYNHLSISHTVVPRVTSLLRYRLLLVSITKPNEVEDAARRCADPTIQCPNPMFARNARIYGVIRVSRYHCESMFFFCYFLNQLTRRVGCLMEAYRCAILGGI